MTRPSDLAPRELQSNNNEVVEVGDNHKNLSKRLKNAKSRIQIYIKATRKSIFLNPGTKKAFN